MLAKLFALYERCVLNRPRTVLLIVAILTAMLASYIPSFKLDASADALVLEGDKSLQFYREVGKRYSSEDFLIITYSPHGDLYSKPVLSRIDELRSELLGFDPVSSVTSILDVPLLLSPKISLSDLAEGAPSLRSEGVDTELARDEFKNSAIYKNLLVSQDASTTAIQVNLKRDVLYIELLEQRENLQEKINLGTANEEEKRQFETAFHAFRDYSTDFNDRQSRFIEEVRVVLSKYRSDADIHLGGVPMIAADMIRFVKSDLVVFGSSILAFMVIMLSIFFKRIRWVVLPLTVCVVTLTAMLGFLAFVDWRMTVVSSNFVALLLIITLSINIHLIVRYRELHGAGEYKSQSQLVRETILFMFKPCLYTALTTIVAFASLVVSGIRPVIDFGWMMTIGILVALLLSFTILPAILMLLPKRDPVPAGTTGSFTIRFAVISEKYRPAIFVTSLLLASLATFGITRLEVENRFIDFFDKKTEIYQGMELIDAQLGGTIPLEIIITEPAEEKLEGEDGDESFDDFSETESDDDDFSDEGFDVEGEGESSVDSVWFNRAGLSRIEAVHDYLEQQPETGKVLSIATMYKVMRDLVGDDIDDIQLALAQSSLPDSISDIMLKPYLIDELNETRISVRVKETSQQLRRQEYLTRVQNHLVDELGFAKENVQVTGMLVLYNNMLQSLFRSQILTIAAVFVAIIIMFLLLFRSWKLAIIGVVPNILAASLILGGMGLAGIPLDMMTITIAAISVGIGVDDTIHYIHRFKKEFAMDQDYIASMYRCHGSIGKAMYYTSTTIIIGFSILVLSNFTPSIYFGLLTGAAMLAALAGALMLLPALIIVFKPLSK